MLICRNEGLNIINDCTGNNVVPALLIHDNTFSKVIKMEIIIIIMYVNRVVL